MKIHVSAVADADVRAMRPDGRSILIDSMHRLRGGELRHLSVMQAERWGSQRILVLRCDANLRAVFACGDSGDLLLLRVIDRRELVKLSPEVLMVAESVSPAARRVTSIAARIAGRRRGHLGEEWRAVLLGDPERGIFVSSQRRFALLVGFLLASLRMRAHDVLGSLWRPVDWVIRTDQRVNTSIAAIVGGQAIYIVGDGGIQALMTEIWEPCGILGGGMYVLARHLRRRRGIELGTPQTPSE
ncbi:hypothetical protein ACIRO3_01790 [Streptomyces sp. NPDC102278]|uniref:hypothetical protein n=1 Tax=Streptomyces sp. NPDC102278 TaxID=3366152 RepID=UPI00381BD001